MIGVALLDSREAEARRELAEKEGRMAWKIEAFLGQRGLISKTMRIWETPHMEYPETKDMEQHKTILSRSRLPRIDEDPLTAIGRANVEL